MYEWNWILHTRRSRRISRITTINCINKKAPSDMVGAFLIERKQRSENLSCVWMGYLKLKLVLHEAVHLVSPFDLRDAISMAE
jgi:hypothetical protein